MTCEVIKTLEMWIVLKKVWLEKKEVGMNLSLSVAEDDRLRDGQCVVEVTECVELPFFSLNCHEELLYTLQRQLITVRRE